MKMKKGTLENLRLSKTFGNRNNPVAEFGAQLDAQFDAQFRPI